MNVNKKLDRFRQWGKEKVGAGGDKTQTTDDFKQLEAEMNLRHEGMEKLHGSMSNYVKSLSKKSEADGKDKHTPLSVLGTHMVKHGDEFEDHNRFGECLLAYGQTNQRLSRMQDSYAQSATSSWLEGCSRSLAQMKDYQTARKKLESRRLAYDASLAKSTKARRDDFRADEELRSQKAKYEESTEEVARRMQDIIDAEADTTADLSAFLEAQLAFHERAAEALRNLQRAWPGGDASPTSGSCAFPRRLGSSVATSTPSRSHTNTRLAALEDEDDLSELPTPISRPRSRAPSGTNSPHREPGSPVSRPAMSRTASSDAALPARPLFSRTATEASASRSTLRSVSARADSVFADDDGHGDDAVAISRNTSWGTLGSEAAVAAVGNGIGGAKKAPPPPPPSRKTKPPPPPPMKKVVSASVVPRV